MADLIFVGQFIAAKVGKTGLTVTVDVDRYTISDGTHTALVTAGAATEARRGLYHYRLVSADLATYQYVVTFITEDPTVDQREIAAIGLVAPDVLVSSRLATAGYTAPPAVGAIADAIADEPMAGHTTPGTAAAAWAAAGAAGDPWSTDVTDGSYPDPDQAGYIIARLAGIDVSAVTQVAASSAGHLAITVGLTFDEGVTGLTIPADWVTALWTLKNNARDADTAALVQLRATNPAAGGDGLQRLNGAALVAPTTAADGELAVTQASGRIDVWLSDEMTAMLGAATAIGWDVKFIDAAGDSTGQRGTADVVLTETKATA